MNRTVDEFEDFFEDVDGFLKLIKENSHSCVNEQFDEETLDESKVLEKLKMLQARKRKMEAQLATTERKARNHRLFKLGEIIETILERPITDYDIKKLEKFLCELEGCNKSFTRAMNAMYDDSK